MLNDLKIMLNIKPDDTLQDDLLNLIIRNITSHINAYIGRPELPIQLEFIVLELATRRYQRVGSEGYQSESVEGHSISFYDLDKEMQPYLDILDKHKVDDDHLSRRGRVMFL